MQTEHVWYLLLILSLKIAFSLSYSKTQKNCIEYGRCPSVNTTRNITWCLISPLDYHVARSCAVWFYSETPGHKTSPLSPGALLHPWLSLSGTT